MVAELAKLRQRDFPHPCTRILDCLLLARIPAGNFSHRGSSRRGNISSFNGGAFRSGIHLSLDHTPLKAFSDSKSLLKGTAGTSVVQPTEHCWGILGQFSFLKLSCTCIHISSKSDSFRSKQLSYNTD